MSVDGSLSHRMHLVVSFQESKPPQNRQLVVHCQKLEYEVDGVEGELIYKTT